MSSSQGFERLFRDFDQCPSSGGGGPGEMACDDLPAGRADPRFDGELRARRAYRRRHRPADPGRMGFHEVSRRRNDRALGGAAAVVARDERGAVALRLGLSNAPSRQIAFDVPGWEPGADPGAIAESGMAANADELTRRIVSASARTAVAQAHGML